MYSDFRRANLLEELLKYRDVRTVSRTSLYFDYLNNNNFTEKVVNSKVLVYGAGAVGSTIVYMLAQNGFKNIIVIDDDIINQTDIEKSFVFGKKDLNKNKVVALFENILERLDVKIQYLNDTYIRQQDIERDIIRYTPDMIIKGCDPDLIFRTNLNTICFKHNVPFINVAYSFEKLRLGPMYVPGYTCCDESINQMQKKAFGEHYDFQSDKKLFTESLVHPAISFNVSMLSSFALKEILMYLTGQYEYCFTIGRLIEFNPLSLAYNSFELRCEDKCQICKR